LNEPATAGRSQPGLPQQTIVKRAKMIRDTSGSENDEVDGATSNPRDDAEHDPEHTPISAVITLWQTSDRHRAARS